MSSAILTAGFILLILGILITEGARRNKEFWMGYLCFIVGMLCFIIVLVRYMRIAYVRN